MADIIMSGGDGSGGSSWINTLLPVIGLALVGVIGYFLLTSGLTSGSNQTASGNRGTGAAGSNQPSPGGAPSSGGTTVNVVNTGSGSNGNPTTPPTPSPASVPLAPTAPPATPSVLFTQGAPIEYYLNNLTNLTPVATQPVSGMPGVTVSLLGEVTPSTPAASAVSVPAQAVQPNPVTSLVIGATNMATGIVSPVENLVGGAAKAIAGWL